MRPNKPDPSSDNCWLLLVVANFALLLAYLLFVVVVAALACPKPAHAWPWEKDTEDKPPVIIETPPPERPKAPPPPEVQPYKIPRFNGKEGSDFHHVPPIKLSKKIDADAVYHMVVNCFPERPQWGFEVKAVAGARLTDDNKVSTFDTAGLARYYAGIVAEMPLYSADERYRVMEQERKRRGEVAKNVSALLKALADRDRALRMLGIGESVEARSYVRVQSGMAQAEEQIGYLKEVATSAGDLDAANAAIVSARLELAGQCRDEVAEQVNEYLKEVTK